MREPTLPPDAGPLQRNIYNMMRAAKKTMRGLSEEAELGETAVRDIITGRSKRPSWRQLNAIATCLGTTVELLDEQEPPTAPLLGGEARRAPTMSRYADKQRDLLPIRSGGRGGGDQQMYAHDPLGHTPRPASLVGVKGAYCIYMCGDSMEPRYEAGWLLFVNPIMPPKRGRAIVIVKKNDAVLVKIFERWDGADLLCRQLNPPKDIRVPESEIGAVHVITSSDENPVLGTRVG